jgi:hypothetical protein
MAAIWASPPVLGRLKQSNRRSDKYLSLEQTAPAPGSPGSNPYASHPLQVVLGGDLKGRGMKDVREASSCTTPCKNSRSQEVKTSNKLCAWWDAGGMGARVC